MQQMPPLHGHLTSGYIKINWPPFKGLDGSDLFQLIPRMPDQMGPGEFGGQVDTLSTLTGTVGGVYLNLNAALLRADKLFW